MNTNQDWKPIASAPKDGTEILAWRHDCGQFIASYTSADAFPMTQDELDAWDEETLFAKDWFTQWPQALRLEGSEVPTLWQPMPTDPCSTCNGHGMIGGPSYYAPDEGGEPCPDCSALPATPDEPYTVVLDPDPRGVSVGVYQGSSCVYNGAHPIPTGATGGEKDEQEFDAKLGAYIREWLRRHGWHPEDGEGEWEFAQRICYEAGRRDAAPYWARTYEDQDNYDQAVADAIKRVAVRIEFAGRPAPAAGDALDVVRLRRIAWLIGSIFVHGNFHAETFNERELEKLLRENGTFWDSLAQFDAALAAIAQQKGEA